MKSMIAVLVMTAVLAAGGIWYMNKLNDVAEDLSGINDEVREEIENRRYKSASQKIDELYGYLDDEERYFEAFSDHEELDKIRMTLSELEEYTDAGAGTEALAKTNVLEFLFEHLPKNYRLRLENIL